MKKVWIKSVALAAGAAVFSLGAGGGCLSAVIQRILVAVNFD